MNDIPTNCNGCCACCLDVGHPPFLLDLVDGVLQPLDGQPDSIADYRRLLEAPEEARSAFISSRHSASGPCAWLDMASGRCRNYDFRPDICRTFSVGGKWCQQHRERVDALRIQDRTYRTLSQVGK